MEKALKGLVSGIACIVGVCTSKSVAGWIVRTILSSNSSLALGVLLWWWVSSFQKVHWGGPFPYLCAAFNFPLQYIYCRAVWLAKSTVYAVEDIHPRVGWMISSGHNRLSDLWCAKLDFTSELRALRQLHCVKCTCIYTIAYKNTIIQMETMSDQVDAHEAFIESTL